MEFGKLVNTLAEVYSSRQAMPPDIEEAIDRLPDAKGLEGRIKSAVQAGGPDWQKLVGLVVDLASEIEPMLTGKSHASKPGGHPSSK